MPVSGSFPEQVDCGVLIMQIPYGSVAGDARLRDASAAHREKTPVATRQAAAADERPTHAPPGHSNSDQAATLVGAAAAALCIQLDGRGKMMRSPNGRCSRHDQSHSAARNLGRTRFPWASLSFSLKTALHLAH
jgi:hypothetical protein